MGFFFNGGFEILFFIVFGLVICTFLYVLISNIARWNKNNRSPVLTVEAKIVSRRTDVTHHHHHNGNETFHTSSSTWYYVTFEVESGDRIELCVDGSEYGLLAEGDCGRLTFQGTRYLRFERM